MHSIPSFVVRKLNWCTIQPFLEAESKIWAQNNYYHFVVSEFHADKIVSLKWHNSERLTLKT